MLAAYLKGSRTNPNVSKDIYQDYDIMYVVKATESFRKDLSWMDIFGKVILKQEQDNDFGYGDRFGLRSHYEETYSWLLLFEDGNRLDIGVETVEAMRKGSHRNKLFLPLLDKADCLPKLPPPTDEDFHVKKPAERKFHGCCNEFFWSLCDVAKGILRDELPFAMTTYYTQAHHMMEVMLEKKAKLSELIKPVRIYPQLLVNVRVQDKPAARNDEDVKAAIAKVEEQLGNTGRILVRESGTEPVIRVMVEAASDEICEKYVDSVIEVIEAQGLTE